MFENFEKNVNKNIWLILKNKTITEFFILKKRFIYNWTKLFYVSKMFNFEPQREIERPFHGPGPPKEQPTK